MELFNINNILGIYVDYILREPVARSLDLQRMLYVNKQVYLVIKGFCEEKLRSCNVIDLIYDSDSDITWHREVLIAARFALTEYDGKFICNDIVGLICDKFHEIGASADDYEGAEISDIKAFAGREYVVYIRWLEYKLINDNHTPYHHEFYYRNPCNMCNSFIGVHDVTRSENDIQYCYKPCCISGCTIRCYLCNFDNIGVKLTEYNYENNGNYKIYRWEYKIKCRGCKQIINSDQDALMNDCIYFTEGYGEDDI